MTPGPDDLARMRAIGAKLAAAGVEVLWVPGWETRGVWWSRTPVGILDHHDASSRLSGEWGALGIIRDGRGGADPVPGPLAQFQIGRGLDGKPRVAIVAAGKANHAGKGGPMWDIPKDSANSWCLGAEAANDGLGEAETAASNRAHNALFAAAAEVCGFPVAHVIGHKEWAPGRKDDPLYDMGWRRTQVAAFEPAPNEPIPEPPRRRDNMVITQQIDPGSGGRRIILPVGDNVIVTERAWLSVAVNGPATGTVRVFFQRSDGRGISDTGPATTIGFANGASKIVGWEIPNGTAQMVVQWSMPNGGTYTIETLSKT